MPIIKFSGVSQQAVEESRYQEVIEQLAKDFQTSLDNITLEIIASRQFTADSTQSDYPFVEICSFERDPSIEVQAARTIHNWLVQIGYEDSDIYYTYLNQKGYYVNGELI